MDGVIVLPGTPATSSINVETRSGSRIQNLQVREVSHQQVTGDQRYRTKYAGPGVIFRTAGPSGMYNCNGLTFASRRTQIWAPGDVLQILREDKYEEVSLPEVLIGDTVVYFGKQDDPIHSGFVIGSLDPPLGLPLICSKWANLSEAIHPLSNCPYMEDLGSKGIKFYRVTS